MQSVIFTMFFVITNADGSVIREYWPDRFESKRECLDAGWQRVQQVAEEIMEKHPSLAMFELSCESKTLFSQA